MIAAESPADAPDALDETLAMDGARARAVIEIGRDDIRRGLLSAVVALAPVIVLMSFHYRVFGLRIISEALYGSRRLKAPPIREGVTRAQPHR